jgi:hypothetical protein
MVAACGNPADIGSDTIHQHTGNTGGGAGNKGTGGSATETGGQSNGSGGATHASGGATHDTGGATTGTGGATHGTGGATTGTGGAMHATGGATHGAGGGTGGIPCGKTTCASGQYCCNASCSMCAPMGAACIQIACDPEPVDAGPPHCVQTVACVQGDIWSPTECKCVLQAPTCASAAECTLVSDYCEGCNCLALKPGLKPPVCAGQTVQCLIDPCSTKSAACVNGHCAAQ